MPDGRNLPDSGLPGWLSAAQADWLRLGAELPDPPPRIPVEVPDRVAALELGHSGDHAAIRLWRRDYLVDLLRNGVLAPSASVAETLAAAERHPLVFQPDRRKLHLAAMPSRGRVVLLVSRFGIQKFGGAEHFMAQMAQVYADLGYAPLVVGTRPDRLGEQGRSGAIRHCFIPETPEALFRLAFEERAAVVHVVSGLGFEVAAALRFLDIRLVFGVHFWREMFHPPTGNGGYFPDCPAGHARRDEFELLLADADAVYVNSIFTRRVLEQSFGLRAGVIPSLADDITLPGPPQPDGRDIVLLANARSDKGFSLLLRVAPLLPQIRFVAIASQSARRAAEVQARQAGASNVEIIDRVEDMEPLYRRARAVLVPSYRFVETFSRVVIEAQRHGVPVLGSDRGNLPFLLRDSGQSLAEDPEAWAAALRRLHDDPVHWQAQSARAIEHSGRFRFADQPRRLERLLAGLDAPLLVGVGSGIGNVVHTTPLLRNLARRLGRPVDVVVAGDSPGVAAVVADPEHVRHVFPLDEVVIHRRYQAVFLTQSFGLVVPPFRAERVLQSRQWDVFEPGHALHEAEFNLAAAQALLGVPYAAEDVAASYVATYRWKGPPARMLVGLHAGSKTGIWAAKRWPHFAALSERLMARGIRVASFGTPDEYVPGTEDRTGGSVEDMAEAMLECGVFVSNDSGGMNLANGMGIPLVAIFAPTEPRTRGPLRPTSTIIALQKPCSPCELQGSAGPFGQMTCRCIAEVPLEIVCDRVEALARR